MIPRSVPLYLVAIMAVLLVGLAVVAAGYLIVDTAGDAHGALLLRRVMVGLLLLIGTAIVLLTVVLALREIDRDEEP